jgi:shikimate dehydrogenase
VFGLTKCFLGIEDLKSVVVLGSGATARSTILALTKIHPKAEITVLARNLNSGRDLIRLFGDIAQLRVSDATNPTILLDAGLVVSTVPARAFDQLWHQVESSNLSPSGLLVDVAYNPWPSMASLAWKSRSISGIELLIWQAIEQVRLFANSLGDSIDPEPQELYEVMSRAVSNLSGSN